MLPGVQMVQNMNGKGGYRDLAPIACHIWKADASAVNFSYQETILVNPTRRQIFAGKPDSTLYNI